MQIVKMTNKNPLIPDIPFNPGPVYKPPPELIKQNVSYPESSQSSTNIDNINPNFDFEENSPSQEGCYVQNISKTRQIILPRTKKIGEPHK